jgi:hypothetical protein
MRQLELVTGVILIVVFAVYAAANIIYASRKSSLAPLIGGVSGLLGFAMVAPLRPFCWLPLIADLGTLIVPVTLILNGWKHLKRGG